MDKVSVLIIYTGGTTGKSKGVMLTNRNLLTNQEGIIRSLLGALPKIDLACIKYGANISEIKFLKAFDLFNSYFEAYFNKHKELAISVEMTGSDIMPDLSVTIARREDKIKIMSGVPKDDKLDLRVIAKLDEQFGTLLNLLPLVYTKKGRKH